MDAVPLGMVMGDGDGGQSGRAFEGDADGEAVGGAEGDAEGKADGEADGARDGEADGDADGEAEGDAVGVAVGWSVGQGARLQLFAWFIMAAARLPLPSMQACPPWLSYGSQREDTRLERLTASVQGLLPCTMTRLSRGQLLSTRVPIDVTDSGISATSSLALL